MADNSISCEMVHSIPFAKQSFLAIDVGLGYIVVGGNDGFVALVDQKTKKVIECDSEHKKRVLTVALSIDPDEDPEFVSGDEKGNVCLWDVESRNVIEVWDDNSAKVNALLWQNESCFFIARGDGTIQLQCVGCADPEFELEGHTDGVMSIALHKDLLASGSKDKTIRLWDLDEEEILKVLEGHEDAVNSVHFSSDGKLLVSGGQDGVIGIWDVKTGKRLQLWQAHTSAVQVVKFLGKTKKIVSAGSDNSMIIWDEEKPCFTLKKDSWKVMGLHCTKDQIICADKEGMISFFRVSNLT